MRPRNILISCILVVVGVAAYACWWVQTPSFWVYAMGKSLNRPGVQVSKLTIGSAHVSWQSIELSQLTGRIKVGNDSFYVSAGTISLDDWRAVLRGGANKGHAGHVSIVGDKLSVSELAADLGFDWKPLRLEKVMGAVKAVDLTFEKYEFAGINMPVEWKDGIFTSKTLSGKLAEGVFGGEIMVVPEPDLKYSMDIRVDGLNTAGLPADSESLLGQVKAHLSGTVSFRGKGSSLTSATGSFTSAEGGAMKAKLLGYIVQYVPQLHQVLEDLIKEDGDITLDQGGISFNSLSQKKWQTKVKLYSKKINLDLNLDADINFDTSVNKWFKRLHRLLIGGE